MKEELIRLRTAIKAAAEFPITPPANQDAHNIQAIAQFSLETLDKLIESPLAFLDEAETVESVAIALAADAYDDAFDGVLNPVGCENSGTYAAENWPHYVEAAKATIQAIKRIAEGKP